MSLKIYNLKVERTDEQTDGRTGGRKEGRDWSTDQSINGLSLDRSMD